MLLKEALISQMSPEARQDEPWQPGITGQPRFPGNSKKQQQKQQQQQQQQQQQPFFKQPFFHQHSSGLTLKTHYQTCMRKARAAEKWVQRICQTHRLGPGLALQVQVAAVQSVALYGAELWW